MLGIQQFRSFKTRPPIVRLFIPTYLLGSREQFRSDYPCKPSGIFFKSARFLRQKMQFPCTYSAKIGLEALSGMASTIMQQALDITTYLGLL